MKRINTYIFFAIVFFLTACQEPAVDDLCCGLVESNEIYGTWALYETGYSPGAGYVVEKVETTPAQTITLMHDGKVVCNINALESVKFYRILTDTVSNKPYLALYSDNPDTSSPHSTYSFELSGSVLKLYFRWCFEGCHMAFKRRQG